MSSLQEKLQRIIADLYKVKPTEVDEEFIRQKREELYNNPNHKFVFESLLGGYAGSRLEVQSKTEIEMEHAEALAILARLLEEDDADSSLDSSTPVDPLLDRTR